jgi:hypothetical protein
VGCGTGAWLATFADNGVEDILGFDGGWVRGDALLIPAGRFRAADFREPIRLDRRFELALSLEVAEHLPATAADEFVASLTALAPIVLFSAAIPFQGGVHHLNEQWPDYWARRFSARGYLPVDCIRNRIWMHPDVDWWYSQNAILFAGEDYVSENPRLAQFVVADPVQLRRVHPDNYLSKRPVTGISVRGSLRLLMRALRMRAKRSFEGPGGVLSALKRMFDPRWGRDPDP